jgi:hypothetical protein
MMTTVCHDRNWWHENGETVVVPEQQAVAVYTLEDGSIAIRQADPSHDEDDIIVLDRQNVAAVARALMREIGQADEPLQLEAPKDPTAAERARRYRQNKRDGTVTPDRDAVTNDRDVTEVRAAE